MGGVALFRTALLEGLRIAACRGDDAPVADRVAECDVVGDSADPPTIFDRRLLPPRRLEALDEPEERGCRISKAARQSVNLMRLHRVARYSRLRLTDWRAALLMR